jgi:hypothetical protein
MRWRLVALLLAPLAACADFGSSPATVAPDGGTDGGADEPAADAAAPPDAAAAAPPQIPFCLTRPGALICDDFDPSPDLDARWSAMTQLGGAALSTVTAASPPRSLFLTLPPPATRCQSDTVSLARDVDVTTSSFSFGGSFWVDLPSGHSSNGGLNVRLEDGADACTMYMHWSKGQPKIVVDERIGGVSTSDAEPDVLLSGVAVPPKTWVRIDVAFDVSSAGTTVSGTVAGAPSQTGTFVSCKGTRLTAFQVKANCYDADATSPFVLGVDDVTLELR